MLIISAADKDPVSRRHTITPGFFLFSNTIFYVLERDSDNDKPPPKKETRRHSTNRTHTYSPIELNLLYKTVAILFQKFSSALYSNFDSKGKALALPTSVFDCYKLPFEKQHQPIHLEFFRSSKRKRIRSTTLPQDSFEEDPDYQEIAEDPFLIFPSTCL